ncbi:flagellin [Bacillus mycoides]|uniref:Flagellin n=1 Tax=Bacillus mycoides TaxID=1405 RepID=A0A1E8BQR6_BACMY|nr:MULTISPECIES: flagellin [Bacillus cereus group]OFD97236.1 flagellin [Bacillus mycoides]OFE02487.1 flagellin [Bacillus mycoides]PGY18624.1 flagellin [Bacillus cereus]
MRINTNINSMRTQEYMRQNQNKMSNAMDRLSSGKRINNASDDAAGLAIATRMRARENGLGVAADNTQNGMALIRTADSALNSVSNILLRMRDIANQSANQTNTDDNKIALNKEFDQLKEQITYIAENTEFNDKPLLNQDGIIKIQTLDTDQSTKRINIDLKAVTLNKLGLDKVNIGSEKLTQAALDLAKNTTDRLKTTSQTAATLDLDVQNAKDAFDKVKGFITDKAQVQNVENAFNSYSAAAAGDKDDRANEIQAAYATAIGTTAADTTNGDDPLAAIGSIDAALTMVASNRATLGATLNRLDFNVNNLKSQQSSMASAASQIEDADMAKEMSEMTKFKILNEAGISMLSQANQTPQMVSKLLQ